MTPTLYVAIGGLALATLTGIGGRWIGYAQAEQKCSDTALEATKKALTDATTKAEEQAQNAQKIADSVNANLSTITRAGRQFEETLKDVPRGDACFPPGTAQRMRNHYEDVFNTDTLPSAGRGDDI